MTEVRLDTPEALKGEVEWLLRQTEQLRDHLAQGDWDAMEACQRERDRRMRAFFEDGKPFPEELIGWIEASFRAISQADEEMRDVLSRVKKEVSVELRGNQEARHVAGTYFKTEERG